MQWLGVALTAALVSAPEVETLRVALPALPALNESSPQHDGAQNKWEHLHMKFHRLLVMHAGPIIHASIDNCWSRCERTRGLPMRSAPQSWLASEVG